MEEQKLTGYPSVDKPWLQYYSEEAINAKLPECTVFEYLYETIKTHLEDIALDYFDRKITFQEMFDSIEKTAKAFSALGVKSGDIVTMCTVTIPETIYAFYALNRLGAISNMVDPRTSMEGLRSYITEVDSTVVLCLDVAYPRLIEAINGTKVEKLIVSSPADSLLLPQRLLYSLFKSQRINKDSKSIRWNQFIKNGSDAKPQYVPYSRNTCCVIEHTGGTTGFPKGVMLSDDNINALSHQYAYGMDTERKQRFLNIMPPFIAYGIAVGMHMPLCCGNTVILIPKFDPSKFDELMVKYKPNHFCGVPAHFDGLYNSKKMRGFDMSFLISAGVGGDRFSLDMERKINLFLQQHKCRFKVAKGYGMTETCSCSCLCLNNDMNKLGSVGIPLLHNIYAVFDPNTGKELKYGEEGEICIQGPTVMLGYYRNEKETKHIMFEHEDGQLWLHSGDLGHIDKDGCVFIVGRIKRMIIRHDGFKVFPTHIEDVVCTHSAVDSCVIIGIPDNSHSQGNQPFGYIVLDKSIDGSTANVIAELASLCQKELPEYVQPVGFEIIDKLPLTLIGKVDYRALEQLATDASAEEQA